MTSPRIPAALPSATPVSSSEQPASTRTTRAPRLSFSGVSTQHQLKEIDALLKQIDKGRSGLFGHGAHAIAGMDKLLTSRMRQKAADMLGMEQAAASIEKTLIALAKDVEHAQDLYRAVSKSPGGRHENYSEKFQYHRHVNHCLVEWHQVLQQLLPLAKAYAEAKDNQARLEVIDKVPAADDARKAEMKKRFEEAQVHYKESLYKARAVHLQAAGLLEKLLKKLDGTSPDYASAQHSRAWLSGEDYEACWALFGGTTALLAQSAMTLHEESSLWQKSLINKIREQALPNEADAQPNTAYFPLLIQARKQLIEQHAVWQSMWGMPESCKELQDYWKCLPHPAIGNWEQAVSLRNASSETADRFKACCVQWANQHYEDIVALIDDYQMIDTILQKKLQLMAQASVPLSGKDQTEYQQLRSGYLSQLPGLLSSLKQQLIQTKGGDERRKADLTQIAVRCAHAHAKAASDLYRYVMHSMEIHANSPVFDQVAALQLSEAFEQLQSNCKSAFAALHEGLPALGSAALQQRMANSRQQLVRLLGQSEAAFNHLSKLSHNNAYQALHEEVKGRMRDHFLSGYAAASDFIAMVSPAPMSRDWAVAESIHLSGHHVALEEKHHAWLTALHAGSPDAAALRNEKQQLLEQEMQHCVNLADFMKAAAEKARTSGAKDARTQEEMKDFLKSEQMYRRQQDALATEVAHLDLLAKLEKQPSLRNLYFMLIRRMQDLNRLLPERAARARQGAGEEAWAAIADELAHLPAEYEQLASDMESFQKKLNRKGLLRKDDKNLRDHLKKLKEALLVQSAEAARRLGMEDPLQGATQSKLVSGLKEIASRLDDNAGLPLDEQDEEKEDAGAVSVIGDHKTTLKALGRKTTQVQDSVERLREEAGSMLSFADELKRDEGNPYYVRNYFELAANKKNRSARLLRRLAADWERAAPGTQNRKQQEMTRTAQQFDQEAVNHREEGARAFIQLAKSRAPTASSLSSLLDSDEIASVSAPARRAYTPRDRVTGESFTDSAGRAKTEWLEEYVIALKPEPGQRDKRWVIHAHYVTEHAAEPVACHVKTYEDRMKGAAYEAETGNMVYRSRVGPELLKQLRGLTRSSQG